MTTLEVLETVKMELNYSLLEGAIAVEWLIEDIVYHVTNPESDPDSASDYVRLKSDVAWALFVANLTRSIHGELDSKTNCDDDILATLDLAIEQTRNPEDHNPIVCRV